jgi:hypothetical protein
MITTFFNGLIGQTATSVFFVALGFAVTFAMVFMNLFMFKRSDKTRYDNVCIIGVGFFTMHMSITAVKALFQINSFIIPLLYTVAIYLLSAILFKKISTIYGDERENKTVISCLIYLTCSLLFICYVGENDITGNNYLKCVKETRNFSDCYQKQELEKSLRRF